MVRVATSVLLAYTGSPFTVPRYVRSSELMLRAVPKDTYARLFRPVPSVRGCPCTYHGALDATGTVPTVVLNFVAVPFIMTVVSPVVGLNCAVVMRSPPGAVGS